MRQYRAKSFNQLLDSVIAQYSFDKKSMTKSHALGIRITCIMLILEEIKTMRKELKEIFIHGCNEKIEKKRR